MFNTKFFYCHGNGSTLLKKGLRLVIHLEMELVGVIEINVVKHYLDAKKQKKTKYFVMHSMQCVLCTILAFGITIAYTEGQALSCVFSPSTSKNLMRVRPVVVSLS
jgi:hypothetical protein